ncbi:MAG: DUF5683 domain-containing protein [Candidatus Cloacimonetes bacterium]|nr:DUF5683 domain-containing protein [Candidatus Cloacimonadota bacterium]
MKTTVFWLLVMLLLVCGLGAEEDSKRPLKAMAYSILPGGGQVYNQKYLKAGVVIGVQAYLIGNAFYHDSQRDKYSKKAARESNLLLKESYLDKKQSSYEKLRNDYWWMAITAVLAASDAFVDAHLYDFEKRKSDVRLKFEDKTMILEYHW